MRKNWFYLLVLAALLLAACSPASSANPTASSAQPAATKPAASAPSQPQTTPVATEDTKAAKMTCQLVSLSPTQGPTEASMFPGISKDDYVSGDNPAAALTIIEYSDFQCPYCAQLAPVLEQLRQKYPQDVRIAFRYFPLPSHPLSIIAASAAEAAAMQGKFWQMHDVLFSKQGDWASMTDADFQKWVTDQADKLGLDKAKFTQDMTSQAVKDKITTAQKHGTDIGIPGTPMVLLNGQYYQGPRDLASLESILNLFKLKDRQYTYCPPMQIDVKKQYIATLKTEKGDIVIQLLPDKAPMAVNSFVFLARQGWFNNVTFHRVIPGFVAQTGDPSGTGYGGPGYSFADEIKDLKFDKEGMVGMANAGPGSNGSQFFITYGAATNLDGKYTVFGQVIQGMDVVKKLTPRDPSQSTDLPPGDKILSVDIQEK